MTSAVPNNSPRSALETLREVRLFKDLQDEDLGTFASHFELAAVPMGHQVYKHGDPSDALYVVRSGSIALYRDQMGKPIQLLARVGRGEIFGELGLFDGFERNASARANETSHLLRIEKRKLMDFLADQPDLTIKLQIAAARRHSMNVSMTLDLSQRKDVRIRLEKEVTLELDSGARRQAQIHNLSLGGLCLRGAPEEWQKHWTVRFHLRYEDESLHVSGRVTWRRDDTLGIAFSRTDPHHEDQIQRLLRLLLDD